ncbi:LAFE_0E12948g1_1 [Lachancea fermentati]|uniref:DNA topoisomerase 2 n=1 Tax=Lachancea fermentati TaxID=4955 RepID=A0A1G4ME76_LACFM|nr:LAFE_0E12948g1_1 [Lachancea fermentati]
MADGKSASERYQKISQLEHILKRPDTYIGSVERQEQQQWIHDEATDCMKQKEVNIVPGLFKIFDEILVNAADNKVRDPTMKRIDVSIKQEECLIEIKNDGKGIPIEIHDKEGIYIPELIFGHLLTSSNYDDDEKKVTGGRNGFGAKLCNIFSTEFVIETADPIKGQKYTQKWENNMSKCHPPKIGAYKKGPSYTKIAFKPDLSRFGMTALDDDTVGVMRRRVFDINGSVRDISVYLNGKSLKIRSFKNYVALYLKSLEIEKAGGTAPENSSTVTSTPPILYERVNDRWEYAFAVSENSFQQISFVNSIATTSGGTHVNYISDQIVKKVAAQLKKKKVKPFQIKNNMFLFINCQIENPAFTSQTKEQLTTRVKDFGSTCEVRDEFIKKIMKEDFGQKILEIAEQNETKALKKTDGSRKSRITSYTTLEDANLAGTKRGYECTLVLTEGLSALSLAVAGLSVVGRDLYGCFPLRGKLLNVREASADQIQKNAEIQAIKKIVGLEHRKRYTDTKSLRYGHIMIMTDQDHDGSHIKGLIINFLESSFPGLLDIPGFLIEFITPIVKVKIIKPRKDTISFYNMPDYEKWREEESHKYTWKQKYYKGLGTSTPEEAREYFSNLDKHLKKFHALGGNDADLIDLAFSKKKADDRKEWLRQYVPGNNLDPELTEIPIGDFINKELILFSLADNIRSIPNVLDGFKPGQRKVLYGCFKRNLKGEIKVAQLIGYISEHTGYHHGEESLAQTIVGMAQDFIGSNNINLLKPNGAFGTRAVGGKDSAATRYINTELNKITRFIFNPLDNPLLNYLQDDDQTIEPEWYLPVIPMVLVNGAEGIGTGWSTNIPPFHPMDIVRNIKKMMAGEEMDDMAPWFRGWTGSLEKIDRQRYKMYGRIEQVGQNVLEITELPAKTWTYNIKQHLLLGLDGNEKQPAWIKDMQENHGATIKFTVTLSDAEMEKTRKIGFYERFKLVSNLNLSNMVAFDPNGRIKKYDDVREILKDFYFVRLEYYQKRKDYMAERLQWELEKFSQQVRFIKLIVEEKLYVTNKPRKELLEELENLNFPRINKDGKPHYGQLKSEDQELPEDTIPSNDSEDENEEGVINGPLEIFGTYDYLLGMKIWSLTKEKYERLLKHMKDKEVELQHLLSLSAKDLWNQDLEQFEKVFDEFLKNDELVRQNMIPGVTTKKKGRAKRKSEDDEEFDPSKKKKSKKAGPAKIKKEEPGFERVLLEQKVVEKPQRVTKVKDEKQPTLKGLLEKQQTGATSKKSKSSTPQPAATGATGKKSKSPTPQPAAVKVETPQNNPSTIFDSLQGPEDKRDDLSIFSNKFKKASALFDNISSSSSSTQSPESAKEETSSPVSSGKTKSLAKETKVVKTTKPTKVEKPPKTVKTAKKQTAVSDDESDFQVSDNEPVAPRRQRRSRAAPARSYEESIDLSDRSFDEGDVEAGDNSDESFHGSDFD